MVMSLQNSDKKILITGGGGFLGYHLANRFFKRNEYVKVIGYKVDREIYFNTGAFSDLTNYEACLRATENIDYVYHCAAKMGGIDYITKNGSEVMTNNVLVNTNMIRAAAKNGVKKFFFPSSFCVYPEHLQISGTTYLKEWDMLPANPDTFYGWEKVFTEQTLRAYSNKMEVRVGRFVSVYGPENDYIGGREKVISAICRKIVLSPDNGEIEIWGDGTQVRSFVYIDDALDAIESIMNCIDSSAFNVSHPSAISINEMTNLAIEASGKNITKKYIQKGTKGVDFRMANITKIRDNLGWYPKVSMRDGIARTYKWIKEDMKK